ncbi:hypothetical protein VNO78_35276 [Psophocarpus tetragonolobus]|uniref:Uncharacterized protein n=1 Tax=Psophocarpus tetragonolobus TaxID=3891 RepID=A0AAN9NMP0_PSOTE
MEIANASVSPAIHIARALGVLSIEASLATSLACSLRWSTSCLTSAEELAGSPICVASASCCNSGMLGGVCARQSHHIAHPRYSAGQESVYEKSLDDNRSPSFFIQKGFSPSTLCLEAGFEEEKLLSTPKPLGRILPHVVLTSGPTFLFLCLISLKSLAPSRSGENFSPLSPSGFNLLKRSAGIIEKRKALYVLVLGAPVKVNSLLVFTFGHQESRTDSLALLCKGLTSDVWKYVVEVNSSEMQPEGNLSFDPVWYVFCASFLSYWLRFSCLGHLFLWFQHMAMVQIQTKDFLSCFDLRWWKFRGYCS